MADRDRGDPARDEHAFGTGSFWISPPLARRLFIDVTMLCEKKFQNSTTTMAIAFARFVAAGSGASCTGRTTTPPKSAAFRTGGSGVPTP